MKPFNPDILPGIPAYGWVGLGFILSGALLALLKIPPMDTAYLLLSWLGYLMVIDSLCMHWKKTSLVQGRTAEFILMLPLSILGCSVFEMYNQWMNNWTFIGVPEMVIIKFGLLMSIFALIFPVIFSTAELLNHWVGFKPSHPPQTAYRPNAVIFLAVTAGLLILVISFITPSVRVLPYIFPGLILVLDPVNFVFDKPSLLGDLVNRDYHRSVVLILTGYVFGVFCELFNHLGTFKILFVGPLAERFVLLEIPLFRWAGYGFIALDCFVLYSAMTGLPGYGATYSTLDADNDHAS